VCITSDPLFAKRLNDLTREIANDGSGAISLDRASAIAEAELDIVRARLTKVALIERMHTFGAVEDRPGGAVEFAHVTTASTMPSQEAHRTVEAMRRALPELIKLDRYERRATARRERAIRATLQL
jgi:hypothetical protein